ncbi:MAG: hypothetical protein FJ122_06295 [Deltaproteobacteria bacterium]|nr:hypothetical protein [Deltaproteobacteria bacterium]
MDVRFAADCNLGTLAKWLRILGYDTYYERGKTDMDFIRRAAGEGRVVLTRKREPANLLFAGRLVVVKTDRVRLQLGEVLEALSLEPDPVKRMTRCLRCNTELEAIPKAAVEGRVPGYVYLTCARFKGCPSCGKVFWSGTHRRNIEESLKMRIHRHL